MSATNRPKRVVMVDADDPMVEVHGEFFWKEDHDLLVGQAHQLGYQEGYRAGWADAARQQQAQPQTVVFRRKPSLYRRIRAIVGLATLSVFMLIIVATVAEQFVKQF